ENGVIRRASCVVLRDVPRVCGKRRPRHALRRVRPKIGDEATVADAHGLTPVAPGTKAKLGCVMVILRLLRSGSDWRQFWGAGRLRDFNTHPVRERDASRINPPRWICRSMQHGPQGRL